MAAEPLQCCLPHIDQHRAGKPPHPLYIFVLDRKQAHRHRVDGKRDPLKEIKSVVVHGAMKVPTVEQFAKAISEPAEHQAYSTTQPYLVNYPNRAIST